MTRRKQGLARANARARDGSLPEHRQHQQQHGRGGKPGLAIKYEVNAENNVNTGMKRSASSSSGRHHDDDGDDDDEEDVAQKRMRTDTLPSSSDSEAAPSWLDTPEPQNRVQPARQIVQPNDGRTSNGYQQRGSKAAPQQAAVLRSSGGSGSGGGGGASKVASRKLKGKGKMREFSLAATRYTPIPMLPERGLMNFIGVVKAHRPPNKSHHGTGDTSINVCLVDEWCWKPDDRISVNMFAADATSLPYHLQEHTVLLLRQVRMNSFNNRPSGVVYKDKLAWATLDLEGTYKQLPGMVVHPAEREHMKEVSQWYTETHLGRSLNQDERGGSEFSTEPHPAATKSGYKRTLTLSQLEDDIFCHCIGEVVRIYEHTERPEVYVTDWTSNDKLAAINNRDLGWTQDDLARLEKQRGDYGGGSVLKITLWGKQVNAIKALTPGNMVFVKNMRCKRANNGMLEGAIGGDRSESDASASQWQMQKFKKSDPVLETFIKRRAKVSEEFEMDRALAIEWPESIDSAPQPKGSALSPAAGASANAQNPNSLLHTDASTKLNEANGLARQQEHAAPPETRYEAAVNIPQATGDQGAEQALELSPEKRMAALTKMAAEKRVKRLSDSRVEPQGPESFSMDTGSDAEEERAEEEDQSQQQQDETPETAESLAAKDGGADKGKQRQMSNSLPLTDSTNSHPTQRSVNDSQDTSTFYSPPAGSVQPQGQTEAQVRDQVQMAPPASAAVPSSASIEQSVTSTLSTNGTPSFMYSLPPPGQGHAAPAPVPFTASHPSASQLEVPMMHPVASTPLFATAIDEEHDSDLDESYEDKPSKLNAAPSRETQIRLAQERADEMIVCQVSKRPVVKMVNLERGQGIGVKHHLRVRVMEIIPHEPSRWVKTRCSGCQTLLPDHVHFCAPCNDEEGTKLVHEWQIALKVQEEGVTEVSSVPVIVCAGDGAQFFADFDPAKHRSNVKAQRKLRERLRPLFGDLVDDGAVLVKKKAELGTLDKVKVKLEPGTQAGLDAQSDNQAKDTDAREALPNPLLHLGAYAFRGPGKGNAPGPIKCKLFGTTLRPKQKDGRAGGGETRS